LAVRVADRVFFIDKSGKQAIPGYFSDLFDEGGAGFIIVNLMAVRHW
jgi:hypothetical protein